MSNNTSKGVVKTPKTNVQAIDKTKRTVLIGAAVGTATAIWHKPVVDAVLLPAHAQTSVEAAAPFVFFSAAAAVSPVAKAGSVLDFLVESAYANVPATYEYAVMVEQTTAGVDSYTVSLFERTLEGTTNRGEVLYSGVASVASGGNLAVVEDPCMLSPSALNITIESVTDAQVELTLPGRSERLVVPSGSGSLPSPMCVDTGLPQSFYNPDADAGGSRIAKTSLLDVLIPTAQAGRIPQSRTLALSASKIDENSYSVGMLSFDRTTLREGIIQVDGSAGSLLRVRTTCDDPDKGANPVSATMVSVDDSTMMLSLNLDGSLVDVELPVGSGILEPGSCAPQGNFTNGGGQGIPFGIGKSNSLGERLLNAVIPNAHAGISAAQALREHTIVNASSNGNGTYEVEIGLSESYIDRSDRGSQIGSVLSATLTLNAESFTDIRNVVAGCNESIRARLSSDGPNDLYIELERIEVAQADFYLSSGTTSIQMPLDCYYDLRG
ncbi:hypothetical protein [Arenicella xantha]|nr:hypothetical protein [Arenicella xantha]